MKKSMSCVLGEKMRRLEENKVTFLLSCDSRQSHNVKYEVKNLKVWGIAGKVSLSKSDLNWLWKFIYSKKWLHSFLYSPSLTTFVLTVGSQRVTLVSFSPSMSCSSWVIPTVLRIYNPYCTSLMVTRVSQLNVLRMAPHGHVLIGCLNYLDTTGAQI